MLAALCSTPTASAEPEGISALQRSLSNGLHVIVLPDHLAPVATAVMEYGAGSNEDTMPGTAHATEHTMFRGTSTVSAAQFAEIADRMGAQYNAETANEFTYYYFNVPSQYIGVVLRLEADRMTNAVMRESDWATNAKLSSRRFALKRARRDTRSACASTASSTATAYSRNRRGAPSKVSNG